MPEYLRRKAEFELRPIGIRACVAALAVIFLPACVSTRSEQDWAFEKVHLAVSGKQMEILHRAAVEKAREELPKGYVASKSFATAEFLIDSRRDELAIFVPSVAAEHGKGPVVECVFCLDEVSPNAGKVIHASVIGSGGPPLPNIGVKPRK